MTYDVIILILNAITFFVTMKEVHKSRKNPRLRRNRKNNLQHLQQKRQQHQQQHKQQRHQQSNVRLYIVSLLIITSFSCFNAIPDCVFKFYGESVDFLVVSLLWSVGHLVDPLIYIFLNRKVREEAKKTVRKMSASVVNNKDVKSPSPSMRGNESGLLLVETNLSRERNLTALSTIESENEFN